MDEMLKSQKRSLVRNWEKHFDAKLEDALTDKGLEKFWSGKTSLQKADSMLTSAAINMAFESFLDKLLFGAEDMAAIVIGLGGCQDEEEHDEEPCNIKNGAPYKIARVEDGKAIFIEDDEFETEEAAKAEIQERVNHSTHTLSDFCVIQVQVCK